MSDRKKIQTFICAMLAALLLSVGCTAQTGTSADEGSSRPVSGETPSSVAATPVNTAAGGSLSAEEFIDLPGLFSDKVEQVLPAGDMVFVRSGAAIWHLDAQGAPKQTISLTGETVSVKAVSMSGGYGILEEQMSIDGDDLEIKIIVHLLDSTLAPKKQIDLNALLNEEFPEIEIDSVAVSPDGSRIAFASDDGVHLLDTGSGKATQLCALPAEVSSGTHQLAGVNSLVFSPDGQSLLYTGRSWLVQDTSKNVITYGKIPLSSGAPDNRAVSAIQVQVLSTQGGNAVFLPDGILIKEDGRYQDGRLLFVDSGSLSDSALALSSKQEGFVVYASENGRYIATIGDSASSGSFTVRVYSRDGGKATLLNERMIKVSEYTYAPNLLLLEDSRLCVALMGNRQEELKTQIEAWTF